MIAVYKYNKSAIILPPNLNILLFPNKSEAKYICKKAKKNQPQTNKHHHVTLYPANNTFLELISIGNDEVYV